MISKKPTLYFKYNSETSWKDGLSFSIKEMSLEIKKDAERYRQLVLLVCFISVFFEIGLGISAFICAVLTDSSSGYAFALDCVLDTIAAALVLWRFYGVSSTYSDTKEYYACISLGILFILAAVGIISKSTYDIVKHSSPQQLVYIFILAGSGGIINSALALSKYLLGKKMCSPSLILEALNTSLSAFLSLMLAVSDMLFLYYPSAWTIDPITSLVVAVILIICGIRVLCHKKQNTEISPLLNGSKV